MVFPDADFVVVTGLVLSCAAVLLLRLELHRMGLLAKDSKALVGDDVSLSASVRAFFLADDIALLYASLSSFAAAAAVRLPPLSSSCESPSSCFFSSLSLSLHVSANDDDDDSFGDALCGLVVSDEEEGSTCVLMGDGYSL